MCLKVKYGVNFSTRPLVALEDIKCYKIFQEGDVLKSPFQGFKYKIGEACPEVFMRIRPEFVSSNSGKTGPMLTGFFDVDHGYHSMFSLKDARDVAWSMTERRSGIDPNCSFRHPLAVYECVIPRDSEYYDGTWYWHDNDFYHSLTSNRITVLKKAWPISGGEQFVMNSLA